MRNSVCCVIPNWNGKDDLPAAIDSLREQSLSPHILVVENGSTDGSLELLQEKYPDVELVINKRNLGFAGGVNSGIRQALAQGFEYIALFNNDAVADKDWLRHLVASLEKHPRVGIATCKFMSMDRDHLDSTGDLYTSWGLPYPRGRGEADSSQYDNQHLVFGASGGASLYRTKMLEKIGLFDEDFFAYYEDVDISWRAQLAGWQVYYEPRAIAHHKIGATSSGIKGFTTYQTLKNIPYVYWRNVPMQLAIPMFPRLFTAYWSFFLSACMRGQVLPAFKGAFMCHIRCLKKLWQRRHIQQLRTVETSYLASMLTYDLPPNASRLRKLRSLWWRIRGRT